MIGEHKPDWIVRSFLALAAILLLWHLDSSGYLWQDEAETALLARNTLTFGYPRAFDGRNYIEIEPFGYGPGEAWIYSPWLPFYVLAAVFAVVGESTWAARLPFALFGWLSVWLTWRLARLVTDDRRVHRLSVALLTCSVPFLLHMRQCRYYAMTTAWLLGVCLAYVRFLQDPSWRRALGVGLALVLLFHTNFGVFIPAVAAVGLHQALWGSPTGRRRLGIVGGAVVALTLPWALFFYRPAFIGEPSLARLLDHLEYYIRVTNKYLVPLALITGVSLLVALSKRTAMFLQPAKTLNPSVRWFMILLVAGQAAFLLLPDQRHLRYVMPTLPILLLGEAWWLVAVGTAHRLTGAVVIALVLFTNVLQSVHIRVPLAAFLYELTHQYAGPLEGVVSYLRQHARPDDVAKIPYDDRSLMFYTQVTVERPSEFLHETYPEWVILRRDWIPEGFLASPYFRRLEATYDRIELDAPDISWQNREDPGSHHFRTVQGAPRVVIFRKRQTS